VRQSSFAQDLSTLFQELSVGYYRFSQNDLTTPTTIITQTQKKEVQNVCEEKGEEKN
jgi:hypothetical protein